MVRQRSPADGQDPQEPVACLKGNAKEAAKAGGRDLPQDGTHEGVGADIGDEERLARPLDVDHLRVVAQFQQTPRRGVPAHQAGLVAGGQHDMLSVLLHQEDPGPAGGDHLQDPL